MVHIEHGSIFDSPAEALVNPVNCVGVMGKGLALQFKERFPDYFADYRQLCQKGLLTPGAVAIYDRKIDGHPRWLISFPTKRHWRDKSDFVALQLATGYMMAKMNHLGIRSIAIPALGCGQGGLQWEEVGSFLKEIFPYYMSSVEVYLYPPRGEQSS